MNLIPFPTEILNKKGFFELGLAGERMAFDLEPQNTIVRAASMKIAECLREHGLLIVASGSTHGELIRMSFSSEHSAAESYRLNIGREGVTIEGEGPRGVFYGSQTLLQLIKENGTRLPCLEIKDSPDFPTRGFLHDVTRGKVPTLDTLKLLADKLAHYKINQLHLYIEHSFAFSRFPELWCDKDPLTAEEIKELDAYCRNNCIELVPTLATFGHLYELIRLKRFEHLNELDIKASELPHNLWDRMAHYTLDVTNEESYLLIKSMIDEFVPLFSSGYCNICCDETFDLGKGKNSKFAEKLGTGRLYIDFVQKLIAAVREHCKTPMIWGDVVLEHPELIGELPDDTVFLNWDYGREVTDSAAKTFAAAGVKQYVCPGVQGWSRFANDINIASENIKRMARYGHENGAIGLLNTDWGDCGHVHFLAGSFHGLALGAAMSWNGSSYPENWQFDASVSAVEWSDSTGRVVQSLRELGSLCFYHFGNMYAWINNIKCLWNREQDVINADGNEIALKHGRSQDIVNTFQKRITQDGYVDASSDGEEFLCSARAIRWSLELLSFKKRNEYGQKNCPLTYENKPQFLMEGAALIKEFERLWRKRNKESELRNVTVTFEKMFRRIEDLSDG
jgi:hypothetical protein